MTISGRLRWLLVDPRNPNSPSGRARRGRWRQFAATFPDVGGLRVVDLGGTVESWRQCPVRPAELTIVNLDRDDQSLTLDCVTSVKTVRGDACELHECLPGQTFDLVYSNSLLEHVGGHWRRAEFARTVRSLAPRYWVQTPYRYFPIEPHYVFPCAQFLPMPARAALARRWTLGHVKAAGRRASLAAAQDIELIGRAELRSYFPDAEIINERFAGLPKSLVALRAEPPGNSSPGPPVP